MELSKIDVLDTFHQIERDKPKHNLPPKSNAPRILRIADNWDFKPNAPRRINEFTNIL